MKPKSTIFENYGDRLIAQKESHLALVRKLFLFLIMGLFIFPVINAQTIMSYKSGLQSLDPAIANQLQSLATDINPAVNLSQEKLTTYGEGAPVVAICNGSSVNMLYGNDPALSQVKLITVTINSQGELPSVIDLTLMQGFTNLQYLLVVFAYDICGGRTDDCLDSKLKGIIQGNSTPVIVFYNLSIPE